MNRRKFLIGSGALAAAGATGLGTGAFTNVRANRSVDVDVADDAAAFLALVGKDTPNGAEYVDEDGTAGALSLDFSETEAGGQGLNRDATTTIEDLFEIRNQGTQEVVVGIADTPDAMSFHAGEFSLNHDSPGEEDDDLPRLESGEALDVGVVFDGIEHDLSELEDFEGSVTIHAYVDE